MQTIFLSAVASGLFVVGYSVANTGLEIADPPPRALVLELLEYSNDGIVTQRLSGGITADWTARIERVDDRGVIEVLCSGSGDGEGIYVGENQPYEVNTWTGGDCPDLQIGDIGLAAWSYISDAGTLVTITGDFVVPDAAVASGDQS